MLALSSVVIPALVKLMVRVNCDMTNWRDYCRTGRESCQKRIAGALIESLI
jgi:hypothetical protein